MRSHTDIIHSNSLWW